MLNSLTDNEFLKTFLTNPVFFYGLLAGLLAVSLFAIFSMGAEDKKARKVQAALLADIRGRAAELEKSLQQKELECKESAGSFQNSLREKDAELSGRISDLEAKVAAAGELKLRLAGLESALGEKEDRLNKANKELALSNQMYNGLKEQYDELEEKFSQLFEEFLKEQKKNLGGDAPKAAPDAPQAQIKPPPKEA